PPLASTLPPPSYSLFPYTTLFRSLLDERPVDPQRCRGRLPRARRVPGRVETRLLRQRGAVPHPAADDLERLDLLADARGEIAFDVVPLVDEQHLRGALRQGREAGPVLIVHGVVAQAGPVPEQQIGRDECRVVCPLVPFFGEEMDGEPVSGLDAAAGETGHAPAALLRRRRFRGVRPRRLEGHVVAGLGDEPHPCTVGEPRAGAVGGGVRHASSLPWVLMGYDRVRGRRWALRTRDDALSP